MLKSELVCPTEVPVHSCVDKKTIYDRNQMGWKRHQFQTILAHRVYIYTTTNRNTQNSVTFYSKKCHHIIYFENSSYSYGRAEFTVSKDITINVIANSYFIRNSGIKDHHKRPKTDSYHTECSDNNHENNFCTLLHKQVAQYSICN